MMRKLIKKGCVLLSLSLAFQFFGCLSSGLTRDLLIDGVTHVGFELLLDNNGILDLFTDF